MTKQEAIAYVRDHDDDDDLSDEDLEAAFAALYGRPAADANAAYIVAACNAYPRLVADRARLVEALRGISAFVARVSHRKDVSDQIGVEACRYVHSADALLRELGE